jgi:DNA-binding MarR family transcriptional regulator
VAGAAPPNVIVALEATTHRVLERLAAELGDLGLSQGEINALAQLEPGATMSVAELQAATGQRASTLTGVLNRLEGRGLVQRAINPRDRRSFALTLTRSGAAAARRVERAFAELEREALASASRRSLKGFFEVLEALDQLAPGD